MPTRPIKVGQHALEAVAVDALVQRAIAKMSLSQPSCVSNNPKQKIHRGIHLVLVDCSRHFLGNLLIAHKEMPDIVQPYSSIYVLLFVQTNNVFHLNLLEMCCQY